MTTSPILRRSCSSETLSMSRFVIAAVTVLLLAGSTFADEVIGTIKVIRQDYLCISPTPKWLDRTITIDANAKVLGLDGNPLAKGLQAEELKAGAEVTITTELRRGGDVITVIRLGGLAARQEEAKRVEAIRQEPERQKAEAERQRA